MRVQGLAALLIALATAVAQAAPAVFALTSTAFADKAVIPHTFEYSGYGCTGDNVSPPLAWTGAPADTKSYALTVFDPDARNGAGWWHWVLVNLPSSSDQLAQGAGTSGGADLPQGALQGQNDFKNAEWDGPCPPPGAPHHYIFTLYALDVSSLSWPSPLTGPTLTKLVQGHVLAKATLTGLFSR